MDREERARMRKRKLVGHHAEDHDDAELWDLMFWQSLSPEDRLSALVHIHQDIQKTLKAREKISDGNDSGF